jgi:phytoene dehydrogenase-like protein
VLKRRRKRRLRSRRQLDAVVVGAGPNGLAAAVTLAQAGRSVLVVEAQDTIGGGTRTAELTLPGFRHDVCSAIHPLAAASPFFNSLDLDIEWIEPPAALAHPFEDGTALLVRRDPGELGRQYARLLRPAIEVAPLLLGPLRCLAPKAAVAGRFAARGVLSATRVARRLEDERTQALFLGAAAHSVLPLDRKGTAGFGLGLLALAHVNGWPFPRGGSQAIADALATRLRELGGEIETGRNVNSLDELPQSSLVLCDVTPRQLTALTAGRVQRRWRYGPGVFKVDYALDGPIPWRAPEVAHAGTVHLGCSPADIVEAERAPSAGGHAERPFVLLAQQSLFDDTRAPAGKQTAWAYCHVPNGSTEDMTDRIDAQIERFAPGFRDLILARATRTTSDLERDNANLVGGDISGGATDLPHLLRRRRHTTPLKGVYLCSASTAPGPGVHGMCGHLAARLALGRGYPSSEG